MHDFFFFILAKSWTKKFAFHLTHIYCINANLNKKKRKEKKNTYIYIYSTKIWVKVEIFINWKNRHHSLSSLCSELSCTNINNRTDIIKFNTISLVLWSLWFERNNHIFQERKISIINLWEGICARLGFWASTIVFLKRGATRGFFKWSSNLVLLSPKYA